MSNERREGQTERWDAERVREAEHRRSANRSTSRSGASRSRSESEAVSYTHLTLPTKA